MSQNLNGIHQIVHLVSSYSEKSQVASVTKTYSEPIFREPQIVRSAGRPPAKKEFKMSLAIDKGHIDLHLPYFSFNSAPNAYSVQMQYDTFISDLTPLSFISTHASLGPSNPYYWYVWTADIFIFMVNQALAACLANLKLKSVTVPAAASSPFFTLDHQTGIVSLNAEKSYFATYELSKPIIIYMNTRLWKFFEGIPVNIYDGFSTLSSPTQRDVSFVVLDMQNNSITMGGDIYYAMSSDNGPELIASWFEAVGIYVVSNNLKSRNEIAAVPSNVNAATNISIQKLELPIIYHYNFTYSSFRPLFIDFATTGTYKIVDIEDPINLKQIDISIYWFDKFGNNYPLIMYPADGFNISLAFQQVL